MLLPPVCGRATAQSSPATIKVMAAGPLGKGVEAALVQLDLGGILCWGLLMNAPVAGHIGPSLPVSDTTKNFVVCFFQIWA